METKNSLVTVIVPVYNLAPYIETCIESVQNQTYRNLEIIIIDDGSTDRSYELCGRIAMSDQRVRLIHQENGGVVKARGRGVGEASGRYLSFIDGDDWIEPDMIESMVKGIGEADLITTGVYEEISQDKIVEKHDKFPEGTYGDKTQISGILKKMIYDFDHESLQPFTPWGVNKLFLTKTAKEIYAELDPEITFAEDAVFVYQYLLKCRSIVVDHRCFYHYRYRKDSALHAVNPRMLMNINRVYLALEAEFKDHSLGACLLLQLQKWIVIMNYWAINSYMGFDQRISIPEFIADISGLENKKIILYGAGKVGQIACAQLKKFGFDIVLWADKNYDYYQSLHMPVEAPEEIFNREYDLVYIAVSERIIGDKIKEELAQKGIPRDKLVWKEPMRVF